MTPAQRPGVLEDPVDDEILGIALAGQAELIVTGDRVLRACGSDRLPIITPREFLERLEERG